MKILLAIDDSKFSEAATQVVIAQGRRRDTGVRVLHVINVQTDCFPELREYYSGIDHSPDPLRKPAEALVEKTAELLRSKGLSVSTAVEWGDPGTRIIAAAAEWHADLIILGSHGRTGLNRFLMGSVAETVVRYAPCSVEIVRIHKS